jgi:hypothetical protein
MVLSPVALSPPTNNLAAFNARAAIANHLKQEFAHSKMSPETKKAIEGIFTAMPFSLASTVLSASFFAGLGQCLQEALLQLVPKAASGVIIRNSWMMAPYEATLEMPEWVAIYLLPTILASVFAQTMSRNNMFALPHYELMGKRMYELEKMEGKHIEIGTFNKKRVLIDKPLLSKLYTAKFMNFAMTAGICAAFELIIPAMRVLLFKQIFHTSDFYKISGLENKNGDDPNAGSEALRQAQINIRNALLYMGIGTPALMGLTWALSKRDYGKLHVSQAFKSTSKLFDISNRFGLSKILIAICILFAGFYTYPSVALNKAEKLEMRDRVLFFAVPCVLFFKQIVGNILAGITAKLAGVKDALAHPSTYFNEVQVGARDIFDLGLVGLHKNKEGKFEGRLTELPHLKRMARENPVKHQSFLKRIYFMEHWAPYLMALVTGIGINILNFMRTIHMYDAEAPTPTGSIAAAQNNIVSFTRNSALSKASS